MVLAKKKLKQQLRSLLATSVESKESEKRSKKSDFSPENLDQQLSSLKELLISKNRRENRPTRRGGKKKKRKEDSRLNPDVDFESKEGRKRKREEDEEQGKEENPVKKNKKKKKRIKNKKNKDKKIEGDEGIKPEEIAIIEARDEIDEEAGKKVYVGGIPYYSTEDDIRSFFQDCGTVTELDCMVFPESGKFRGIAIISFKTEAAAKRALALDGSDMGVLFLKIKPYKGAQKPQKSSFSPEVVDGYNRIYMGNLAWEITEEELRKFFNGCKISAVRFGEDKETGEFKGYAHVDFHDAASLAVALKLDQAELCGRPARISAAVPRKGASVPRKGTTAEKKKAQPNDTAEKKTPVAQPGGVGEKENKKKKKRQTCYECGVPGHLSSECPQKKQSKES